MLSSNLNPTFILAIFIVYGLNQGFSGSFFKVVTDYYEKDVQKLQPSTLQIYRRQGTWLYFGSCGVSVCDGAVGGDGDEVFIWDMLKGFGLLFGI
ncbi:hypothetical protein LINPERHAP2_LOCUS21977 [Linum perenne]